MTMPTSTQQDRDAALVDHIAEQLRSAIGKYSPIRYADLPEESKDVWRPWAQDIIETVRTYDMDQSASHPLPQEMP